MSVGLYDSMHTVYQMFADVKCHKAPIRLLSAVRKDGSTMSSRLTLGAMILLPGISIAAASTLSMPDTPAGHTLGAWLDAFNSDDSARIKAFDDVHAPWLTLDRATGLREHSGGYELLSIGKSEKLWITFSAREKATATPISGTC